MNALKTWRCPECAHKVEAIATEVRHRCPGHRLRWVHFKPVEEVTKPKAKSA